ncbi:hypothetical protein GSI_05802 [Ganoderma sinense ZZ0214-1]|uniref:DUF6532 domain-containing protein n=1 Tax=Ganoderma sinense ZZ0214-1 TaxID=1077348 RepID=A0A2G8SBG0_9APHY|nr:hypothetical protein GSI_05802 [Ganoderma sinense ZZ0214-1]
MSARRRSQTQSASQKNIAHRTNTSSNPSLQPKATPVKANPVAATRPQDARTPTTKTPSTQNRRLPVRTTEQAQQAVAMGPPATPAVKTTTPSRPQRQSKVDALAKKVWNAVAPSAGRKRANPAVADQSASMDASSAIDNSDAHPDSQPPVSKKRKAPIDVDKVGAPIQGQQQVTAPTSANRRASATTGGTRNAKTIPRVQVSVDSDSSAAVESDDDVPLKQRQAGAISQPSTAQSAEAAKQKPHTRGAHAGPDQAKARVESAVKIAAQEVSDAAVESDASNSVDEYAPDEDDEAYSEEDELEDPLSEDLDELEAQLREEAPVWTNEKNDSLPPVLRRKQAKKDEDQVDFKRMMELAEEQACAGKTERSTSKATQRRQLEQPVWKAPEPAHPDDAEDGMEPWSPVEYYIPAPDDPHWEENRGTGATDDSDEPQVDEGTGPVQARAYDIKPPATPGGVLSLKEQDAHIQDMIRHTFLRVESNLVFDNGFPDAVGRARFVYEAMQESAKELAYGALDRLLGTDQSFARTLASLPNQRISTFRSNIKKNADSTVGAFYGVQQAPGQAGETADKVEWTFDHLKYIYPLVLEPADKRSAAWAKPYQNPAVASMLRSCFFTGATAVGNRDAARFVSSRLDREDELEIPMPMLALVGAAIHASLSEWRTGIHKKGTFSADSFLDAYTEHVTLLTGIKAQNPRAYHTMMHRLYCEASGVLAPAANVASASDALAHVDFAGMEVD